ncbi:MAG: hypothetical protein BGO78_11785 [Chloroflexi bacterium 44-23]|nr:MAG: hypothetical protein BGO78_11785 [Chloroflexi bacterium 44-23]
MKVIVIGCGRLGSEVAYLLYKHGNEVSIVDKCKSAFEILKPDFKGIINEGDALSQETLKRAGIENADAVAIATSSDAINLVVGRIAAEVYHVKNVVSRNFEPNFSELFEIFGLEVISGTNWGASRMEEMILNEKFRLMYSAGSGEVDYYEVIMPETFVGNLVSDLHPQPGSLAIVSVTRLGRSFIPALSDELEPGDHVHVSATHEGIEALRKIINLRK